jgi:hypothetical protein
MASLDDDDAAATFQLPIHSPHMVLFVFSSSFLSFVLTIFTKNRSVSSKPKKDSYSDKSESACLSVPEAVDAIFSDDTSESFPNIRRPLDTVFYNTVSMTGRRSFCFSWENRKT